MVFPHQQPRKKSKRPKRRVQPDQLLALLLLLFWLAVLLGNFVFRGQFVFEGNAVAQEISFTYSGQSEKRFLNRIQDIRNLDLEGSQPEPLVLTGKFSSPSDPALNQKLAKLSKNQLTIQLPYAKSRLILSSLNPAQSSELAILGLKLSPASRVNQLAYSFGSEQLSFCLQAASQPAETCLFPDSLLDRPTSAPTASVGDLELSLGQPLTVSLELVNISELGIKADVKAPQTIALQFVPAIDNLIFTLLSPTRIYANLPKPPASTVEIDDSNQWIRGDITAENVSFTRFEMTSDVIDELKVSTVLQGEIRMGREVMQLQPKQFLVPQSKPGIQKLRYIQPHANSPQGLQTRFAGQSSGIATGLYPEFPVQKIEPSWLSRYLSQEGVNALLAFIAGLTGVLLPRLFPSSSE